MLSDHSDHTPPSPQVQHPDPTSPFSYYWETLAVLFHLGTLAQLAIFSYVSPPGRFSFLSLHIEAQTLSSPSYSNSLKGIIGAVSDPAAQIQTMKGRSEQANWPI
ncbi:hypothetical protein K402DRAFT_389979 [Aulographum hederae CBS 113979]|uniref:Uncharacterized protein n=1 Tax=Aulographum hederae CBS 113979 TaxID=1176131 RepID=A0A6G1HB18_9PEZI|nr:hypothetical protein K402DRAFT_389979 [Aulographum hederae CBS 113979]